MDHTANGQATDSTSTITPTGKTSQDTSLQRTTSYERHSRYNINYYYARQLIQSPLSSSSSYDYWWPYPPGGVATTIPTTWAQSEATPTVLAISATVTSTPILAFPIASDSASSFASDSLITTPLSSSVLQPSTSESLVSISALPASNTSLPTTSNRKVSMSSPSKLVYIVPVCAVVGVLVGGITAWCVYGCLTRNNHGRRRGRKSYGTLEVGPEYTPPTGKEQETEEGTWVGDQQDVWVEDEKRAEESDEDEDDAARGSDDDEPGTGNETKRFLHPGAAQKQGRPARTKSAASTKTAYTIPARAKSTRSSRAPSPTPSGRTSLFFDRPDPTDALPWESLRHKSIKRGILARLEWDGQQDTNARRPWQAHGRHDSDLQVADARADLARSATSSTAGAAAALSRASSTVTTSTRPGFRMQTESPAGTPQKERGADVFAWPRVEDDRYTRVPARVARSRSRSPEKASRAGSPDKLARAASPPVRRGGRDNAQRRGRSPEVGNGSSRIRGVLPQSPPRITSPVLDGALCFTPIPSPRETTPILASFASFGGPAADLGLADMKRGTGGRDRRRRD
ncbi:hypothetical protein B0H15DRAFT_796847 [Mycena belliarum]|uniref:Transmembrane protein n=1 Tax=Mycena belliarum TaxID=1033014 RepID=A0AAD6UH56_9AGAR|nr:hypothetical protein B0H15DRAFT_796847 [Mycena belliae]